MAAQGMARARLCPGIAPAAAAAAPRRAARRARRGGASAAAAAAAAAPAAVDKLPSFPFPRIAGQEEMKLALLLNVVDPRIGGVLIMGDRGTGKSTAVRALAEMLPPIDIAEGDEFNSSVSDGELMSTEVKEAIEAGNTPGTVSVPTPMIELPLGATEDRICGTINMEKALMDGAKAYEPGLLAKANRGILYVDEVNLLEDSLVDVVLDSAASGWNTVEREGISVIHPARFIMIGSGNPEEGELRPQLLDRFGLAVTVRTMFNEQARVQLVLDRLDFERDADAFVAKYEKEVKDQTDKITAARERLSKVEMDRDLKVQVSEVCSMLDVDGLRGDMVVNRAARALVAYEGRTKVTQDDVERVIGLALAHRMRKDPLDSMDGSSKVQMVYQKVFDPAAAQKAAEAKAAEGAAAAEAAKKNKKAGSWGGLPGQ